MTSRISKGSITGRAAFSNGGLGLSIGSKVSGGIRHAIGRRAPDASKIAGAVTIPTYVVSNTNGFMFNDTPSGYSYITNFIITTSGSTTLDKITGIKFAMNGLSDAVFNINTAGVPQVITKTGTNTYEVLFNFTITGSQPNYTSSNTNILIENATDTSLISKYDTYIKNKKYTITFTSNDTCIINQATVTNARYTKI